jgi:hypothetical protein
MDGKPKRRWLRYSIRTLLVAVTIFCAWLSYQLNWIQQREAVASEHQMVAQMLNLAGGKFSYALPRPNAPWPLRWMGADGYAAVIVEAGVPEFEITRIQTLFAEATVSRE